MPKASDNIKIYRNPNGPVVSTVNRRVLEQDGLTFKDIDGTGTLSPRQRLAQQPGRARSGLR